METILVKESVPSMRVADMLCNALEGGSNYWYMIEEKTEPTEWTRYGDYNDGKTKYAHLYPFNKGGALIFSVMSEERDEEARKAEEAMRYTLDFKAVEKGLQAMALGYRRHYADFITGNDDATTADVFLQCCLFGEAIYG